MLTASSVGGWREFLDHARAGRRADAIGLAVRLTDGLSAVDVVCDVLARVQAEAGAEWERGCLSVDDIHRVSAASDAALAALAGTRGSLRAAGPVVYACAPGEWHVLAARLASAVLELEGWHVIFAGANTTPDRLRPLLARDRPVALGVSATSASRLPSVLDLVEVAQEAGIPTFVGGRAFTRSRARAVGASAYVADARDAADLLRVWQERPTPPPRPPAPGEGYADLVLGGEALCLEVATAVLGPVTHADGDGELRRRLNLGVTLALEHLAAAVYLGDESVFVDFVRWSRRLAAARGFPEEAAMVTLEAMTAAVGARVPGALRVLAEADRVFNQSPT